jgi:hypothetical protein
MYSQPTEGIASLTYLLTVLEVQTYLRLVHWHLHLHLHLPMYVTYAALITAAAEKATPFKPSVGLAQRDPSR